MRSLLLLPVLSAFVMLMAQEPLNAPVKIPSGVFKGVLVKKVPPRYPAEARQAHVEGSVTLRVLIGVDGHPSELEAVSGPVMLRDAALNAVKQWIYAPYLVEGLPRSVSTLLTLNFAFSHPGAMNEDVVAVGPQIMAGLLQTVVDPTSSAGHAHGIVRLSFVVDNSGRVRTMTAEEGSAELVALAEQAVSNWRYSPYLAGGTPVPVKTTVSFDF